MQHRGKCYYIGMVSPFTHTRQLKKDYKAVQQNMLSDVMSLVSPLCPCLCILGHFPDVKNTMRRKITPPGKNTIMPLH